MLRLTPAAVSAALAAAFLPAQAGQDLGQHRQIAVLYAGEPGNPREAAFTEFLSKYFAKVGTVSLEDLGVETAKGYDVVIADWRRFYGTDRSEMGKNRASLTLPQDWSRPTIMIGAVNGEITRPLGSKIDWL
jgi:hypothetical protein